MKLITLYTKPGCHLCEAVEQAIAQVRRRREFQLVVRNILDDPADFEKYQHEIPVVLLDGREIARYRMSSAELEMALESSLTLDDVAVIVMTKFPEPGKVKSRLCPPLTPQQAADVHRAFLAHFVARLEALQPDELVICFDPPDALERFRALLGGGSHASFIAQRQGDLGRRMAAASAAVGRHHRRLLIFGVDSPDVPDAHILTAGALTGRASVVLGECADGGYWCLGLWNEVDAHALLANISWSSGREARQTLDHAGALGYSTALAPPWRDVDREPDLRELIRRRGGSSASPADAALSRALAAILPAHLFSDGATV